MAVEPCFAALCSRTPQSYFSSHQPLSSCALPICCKASYANLGEFLAVHSRVFLVSASKKKSGPAAISGKKPRKPVDDAWESLFDQLEKDLENEGDDFAEEDITEDDMVKFERELDSVLGDFCDGDTVNASGDATTAENKEEIETDSEDKENIIVGEDEGKTKEESIEYVDKDLDKDLDDDDDDDNDDDVDDDDEYEEDEFEKPREVKLERWQLRKLAAAAELNRRKVNIKSLAAELQLDRADVLSFLKAPPPELLSIALEESKEDETNDSQGGNVSSEADSQVSAKKIKSSLSHVKETAKKGPEKGNFGPRDWNKKKRLRKVHLDTFERVYSRTRRPTNAMIYNLVHLTNLPRSRILEWFDKRRLESSTQKISTSSRKSWRLQANTEDTSFSR